MRRPAGTGLCCPIISFTLETAFGVSETGGVFFTSGTLVFTSGTVVVAIPISLALKYLHYSRGGKRFGSGRHPTSGNAVSSWMPGRRATIPPRRLPTWSIMLSLGPSSRLRIVGKSPHPRLWWICQTGLQTVEVAYAMDVDSFNPWIGDRVGRFHGRPDHSAHLPQHADHA